MTRELADGPARSFAFGAFTLVPERQLLLEKGAPVRIGGRALDLLTALVERPGEVLGKDELLARVWPDTVVEESNLKVHMATLRRVLGGQPDGAQYVATVIGRGYRFVAPVQASGQPHSPEARATPARSHNLPTGTTRIFGRAGAIEAIVRDLEESRLVSIVGAGGIGKTTVALAASEQALERLVGGACFVDLGLVRDPTWAANAIATALGVAVSSADVLSALCESLGQRELLLVLDNCEHVIDAVAICVDRILTRNPGVRLLTTSREPLRVKGERIRRLAGLDAPPPTTRPSAAEALTFPAVQLFVERAINSFESFELTDTDAPMVAEICRRLDGLALAIELAATRTDVFGVGGLLQQLDNRFRVLTGRRAGPERHRTLTATLDWSYGLLSAGEAAFLRAVSVFAGAFESDGAAAVSSLSAGETADTLAQLASKSLLTVDLDADTIAYRLLETTRSYCLERLRGSDDEQAIRARHAEYICQLLERATNEWAERPASEWAFAYGRSLDDLRSALAWTDNDEANRLLRIRLTLAGILLWNHFSLTRECSAHVARAVEQLEAAGLTGTAFEMKLELWLGGSTMFTRGFKPQALVAMRRALEIADEMGDADYRLRSRMMIGIYELFTGEHLASLRTLAEFAELAAARDPSILPESELHSSIAELFLGRLGDAQRRLEALDQRSLRYFKGTYGVRYLSDTAVLRDSVLAHVQWLSGSPDAALRTTATAIEQAQATGHHLSLNNALSYACATYFWSGDFEECGRRVAQFEENVARHGLVARRPVALFYRAALTCAQDRESSTGLAGLARAVEEFRDLNHLARMPYYLGILAEAIAQRGMLEDAEATLVRALDSARDQSEEWCRPELLRVRAWILSARGEPAQAKTALVTSMALAEKLGASSWRLRAATDLAQLLRAESKVEEARQVLRPVFATFTEGFATRDLLAAAELLASLAS